MLAAHGWCDHAADGGAARAAAGARRAVLLLQPRAAGARPRARRSRRWRARARRRATSRDAARSRMPANSRPDGTHHEALQHLQREPCHRARDRRPVAYRDRAAAAWRTYLALGDTRQARSVPQGSAGDLAQEMGDKREIAAALSSLAQLHRLEGDFAAAEALSRDVSRRCARAGRPAEHRLRLLNLAMIAITADALAIARVLACARPRPSPRRPARSARPGVLDVAAGLAAASGDWARAARFFGAAEEGAAGSGVKRDPADEAFVATVVGRARAGDPRRAGIRQRRGSRARDHLGRGAGEARRSDSRRQMVTPCPVGSLGHRAMRARPISCRREIAGSSATAVPSDRL